MVNDPAATLNAAFCAGIVITLMFYRRGGSRHRRGISLLAWLMTVIYSTVPLAYLCGNYPNASWLSVTANLFILTALVAVRGNVARIFDLLRH